MHSNQERLSSPGHVCIAAIPPKIWAQIFISCGRWVPDYSVSDARPLASWPHGGLMRSFCSRLQGFQDPAAHRSCVGAFKIPGVRTKEG